MAETAQQKADRQMLETIVSRGDKLPTDGRSGSLTEDYDTQIVVQTMAAKGVHTQDGGKKQGSVKAK